jgi:hypothetical protein
MHKRSVCLRGMIVGKVYFQKGYDCKGRLCSVVARLK